MPATFDCPKCGAPISFEPKPGDETVKCDYCGETVVIPDELQIPLPRETVAQPSTPVQTSPVTRLVMILVTVLFSVVCLIGIATYSGDSTSDTSTSSSVNTGATATALSALHAAATVEAKATVAALQPMLKLEQGWPTSFRDNFTENSHKWPTGDVRSDYVTGNRSIGDGIYAWNITSVKSAFDSTTPEMNDLQDFYASVDLKMASMPDDPDADAGMIFRNSDADRTWYYFSISPKAQYYFGYYDGSQWSTLIPETDSPAIRSGQTNRLVVGAQGSQFIFMINDQMIDHFIDDHLKSGTIGVGVNLPKAGEKAGLEFANLVILAPSANP